MFGNEYWNEYEIVRGKRELTPILKAIGDRGFVAGSYAAYVASPLTKPMQPNDIDIFATSESHASEIVEALADRYWVEEWNDLTFTLRRFYRTRAQGVVKGRNIQVVKPNPAWKDWPSDLLASFDFDVCRAVVISPDKVVADDHLGWYRAKVLRVNNPLRSLKRAMKYHARGVEFDDSELLKLFLAWDQLPPERKTAIGERIVRAEQEAAACEAQREEIFEYGFDDDYFEGE